MSNMVNLSRAAAAANIKRLQESVANSGVPTHKYLSFNAQRGEFYVRENDGETPVPVGTKFAVNWQEISHGFVCWKDGKVFDSVSWKILSRPTLPDVEELPDHGPYTNDDTKKDGWKEQVTIPMKDLKTGVEYLFKTGPDSAVRSARRFISDLNNELMLRVGPSEGDEVALGIPVVTNAKTHFVPKGRTNKVFLPKFELQPEWVKDVGFSMNSVKGNEDGVFMLSMIEGDKAKSSKIAANVTDAVIEE